MSTIATVPDGRSTARGIVRDVVDALEHVAAHERMELIAEIRQQLQHTSFSDLVEAMDRWLADERERLGLCRVCGGKLRTRTWNEARPYGSTIVRESMSEQCCCECGEVA